MAGRDNTTRIEQLESQTANLAARLDVHDAALKGISEVQAKGGAAAEGHAARIVVIEQQLLVLADLKAAVAAIAAVEKEIVSIKKDVEANVRWQQEEKK